MHWFNYASYNTPTKESIVNAYMKLGYWLFSLCLVVGASFVINSKLSGIWLTISITIGILLFVYSIALASIAGKTLKRYAHLEDKPKSFEPNKFTSLGIYSIMRHPMHLALALLPISVAFMMGSLSAILASGWSLAMALIFILFIEEPEAIKKYGTEYVDYILRVPAWNFKPNLLKDALKALKE